MFYGVVIVVINKEESFTVVIIVVFYKNEMKKGIWIGVWSSILVLGFVLGYGVLGELFYWVLIISFDKKRMKYLSV